ncbi:MAG: alpha/beta hydrolase [Solimonas sp.]
MKIDRAKIDRELRWPGRIMSLLFQPRSVAGFRRMARLGARLQKGRHPRDLDVREVDVPRRDGGTLRLVVYRPPGAGDKLPGLLWLHGGGYLLGLPEQDIGTYRRLIAASPCVIVAPDYRLAPDAPYPAALDDGYDALLWLQAHAREFGVRDDQLAVAGMSAGGGLCAALTPYARDRGEVNVAFQLPLYPMIDDRNATESARDNDAPVWNARLNRLAWDAYLGSLRGRDDVPPYAAAARATDWRGLPPTCTFVGDLEPFRDETRAYVANLRAAGVPVAFECYDGAWHGFDVIAPKAAVSRRATGFWIDWYAQAVRQHFAAQPDAQRPTGT